MNLPERADTTDDPESAGHFPATTSGPLKSPAAATVGVGTMMAPTFARAPRTVFVAVALVLAAGALRSARAEDLAMPAEIEAKLSGKVAAYERTFVERAGGKVVVAIIAKSADADSSHAAASMQSAFRALDDIGGLPHEEFILAWTDGPTLAETCLRRKVAVVYVAPGLASDIGVIAKTLEQMTVLSIAGSLPYVEKGLVLGFDLVSGRPKVVINLTVAKKQNLRFRSDLLSLARIIE